MDIQTILVGIAQYAIQLIILIVGSFLIALGKKLYDKYSVLIIAKIGKNNYELAISLVKTIVQSIEQKYPQVKGIGKYELAMDKVSKLLEQKGITLTELEKQNLIESSVREMNYILKPTIVENKTDETPKL